MFKLSSISGFLLGLLATTALALPVTPTAVQPASAARLQTVQVFFPKNPPQNNDLGYVEPVLRRTQSTGVAQFAVSQVIVGPNRQERQRGFIAPIRLQGTSNCSGRDFTLSIASGTARLQFCRQVISAGVGDDARITSSLNATLKQFPTVRSVVLLDREGRCLGDMSGENLCLRR
ncbi:GerMN domain-containing protein [Leptolyngbya ohadii]|uniref:GerMN domain-containing protein n=1 Tax=Leptolyngbya ohadii TaxID=1962290 RepID=UPI000B5A0D07|nr:GerMN domain-containing protein [Leptolyngbya ohadii]